MQQIAFQILFKDDKKNNKWQTLSYEDVFERVDDVTAIYWNIVPQDKSIDRV